MTAGSIDPKTRFVEGCMNGVKFSIAHSLVFAPFMVRLTSLDKTMNPSNLTYR